MRNLIMVVGVAVIGLGGSACAYNPPPVPVFASRADWEILAGNWRGGYTATSQGRSGVIEFKLSAGDEQAFGDVVMIPSVRASRIVRTRPAIRDSDQHSLHRAADDSLRTRRARTHQRDHGAVLGSGPQLRGIGDLSRGGQGARDRGHVHVPLRGRRARAARALARRKAAAWTIMIVAPLRESPILEPFRICAPTTVRPNQNDGWASSL
jgi:hypothetical protein